MQEQQNEVARGNSPARRGWSAWRCYAGALATLTALIAVGLAGCGGGGGGNGGIGTGGGGGGTTATALIQVRDKNTGTLLPSSSSATPAPPVPGQTPIPTATPAPISVRVVGNGIDRTQSDSDPAGISFTGLKTGTYQVFVDGVRAGPDIVIVSGGGTQLFQVVPGITASRPKFFSDVTVTGRTLLSLATPTPTGTPRATPRVTPTPTTANACPDSSVVTGAYFVRVIDINQPSLPVVALFVKPSGTERFTIKGIPLPTLNGRVVSSSFVIQIFTDPNAGNSFSGSSAAFTIGKSQSDSGQTLVTLPDICARRGGPDGIPTAVPTATGGPIPTATPTSGVPGVPGA